MAISRKENSGEFRNALNEFFNEHCEVDQHTGLNYEFGESDAEENQSAGKENQNPREFILLRALTTLLLLASLHLLADCSAQDPSEIDLRVSGAAGIPQESSGGAGILRTQDPILLK